MKRRNFMNYVKCMGGAAFVGMFPATILGNSLLHTASGEIDGMRANPSILRGEHLVNLQEYLQGIRLKWNESKGYSSEFAKKHDEILKDIIEKKKNTRIVTGFDEICNCGVCPNRKESCQSTEAREHDNSIAAKYGVTIGREYKFKELIKLFRKMEETGKLIT